MGGCGSVPEEEVYEYPSRRRYRPPTPIMYSRPPQRTLVRQPMQTMQPMHPYGMYGERRYGMPPPVIDDPYYGGGYRKFGDDFGDYNMLDRGRSRYSYHSYTR